MPPTELLARVDHLVYAAADLERGVAEVEQLLGVRASPGGHHPSWGTRNALVALGPASYLEIIAPDPDLPPPAAGRPFGLDTCASSRLAGWAAKGHGLSRMREAAGHKGVELGNVISGRRQQADGTHLSWQLTDLRCVSAGGVVPFFIDWENSPHPAAAAARGATLYDLRAEHPDAGRVLRMLRAIEIELEVGAGAGPALIATIDCPKGRVLLR